MPPIEDMPNQVLQRTGHAISGFSWLYGFSRVSRPLSVVVMPHVTLP